MIIKKPNFNRTMGIRTNTNIDNSINSNNNNTFITSRITKEKDNKTQTASAFPSSRIIPIHNSHAHVRIKTKLATRE